MCVCATGASHLPQKVPEMSGSGVNLFGLHRTHFIAVLVSWFCCLPFFFPSSNLLGIFVSLDTRAWTEGVVGGTGLFFLFFLFFVPASASHTSAAVRRTEIQALNLRNLEY